MKQRLALLLLTIGLGMGLALLLLPRLRVRGDDTRPETAPVAAASAIPSPTPPEAQPPELHPVVAPRREEVVREARENPHATPESLRALARLVAERSEQIQGSLPRARRLFVELSRCALASPEQTVPSAQAYCLSRAQGLSQAFPALGPEYDALIRRTAPQISRLMDAGERL